jgi:NAD(P)H dehydrogenase (quinone)
MKHAVILGHPNPHSFNATIAHTFCDALHHRGHVADLRDLYGIKFDPLMQVQELPDDKAFGPAPEVVAERARLHDVDAFTFIYPLWFNAPPAIIKGYVERVFGMGFGYGPRKQGANPPLLVGRKLLSITTSGAPAEWLKAQESWAAIRTLADKHVADVCGLTVLDHLHFGGIHPGIRADFVERCRSQVSEAVARLF